MSDSCMPSSSSPPLRIVKAMPFFAPATQFGGPVIQAEGVCKRLAQRGHHVSVVTTDNGIDEETPRGRWLDRDGYQIYYARTKPLHRVPPYYSPSLAAPLAQALRAADVLCLNVGLTLLNHLAMRQARNHGVPYVYNAEGALCPVRLQIKSWRKKWFLRLVERRVIRNAAVLQALTPKDAADLRHQGAQAERIRIIPNGIGRVNRDARPAVGDWRSRWGLGEHDQVVLFMGRLQAIKGLDLLVQVVARAAQRFPGVKLVIAGPDQDAKASIQALAESLGISDHLVFTGHLDGEAKQQALQAADLFALTSRSEGLPYAVLEASAAGLPLLLSEDCNVPEVADCGAGFVERLNGDDLNASLCRLLADADLRRDMGSKARQLADQVFSLDRVVDQLESLYRELASNPRSHGSLHGVC